MRRSIVLISALAALGLIAADAEEARAAEIIDLPKTGKLSLEAKCTGAGGKMSDGTQGSYSCTGKGGNVVECDKDGNCVGIVQQMILPGGQTVFALEGMTLQMLGAIKGEPAAPGGKKMPKTGILDSGPGFSRQGPAATGTPGTPDMPPPPPPPPAKTPDFL